MTRIRRAFTLIELLVVLTIIGLLVGLLVPVLGSARDAAIGTSCLANQQQLLVAVGAYAADHRGKIPYGPVEKNGGQANGPDDFYIFNGMATSQISTKTGDPAGAGIMLDDYLSKTPEVLFCPGTDQEINVQTELARAGTGSSVGGYIYRHASTTFEDVFVSRGPDGLPLNPRLKLDSLGDNRRGEPIQALFLDYNFLLAPGSIFYNAFHRSNHNAEFVNAAYADGHAEQLNNADGRYSVDIVGTNLHSALEKLLIVMEEADTPD